MTTFNELLLQLCEPFPENVHLPRHDGQGTYIPIHVYLERLNKVAGEYWSHERIGEPIFYMEDKLVHTIVKVTIQNRSHMGEGFSKFQINEQGFIINRHYAIRSATKDAIRDAISFFGMGKHSSNQSTSPQGEQVKVSIEPMEEESFRTCMKCGDPLTQNDIEKLMSNQIKFDYCAAHIPKHFLRTNRNKER